MFTHLIKTQSRDVSVNKQISKCVVVYCKFMLNCGVFILALLTHFLMHEFMLNSYLVNLHTPWSTIIIKHKSRTWLRVRHSQIWSLDTYKGQGQIDVVRVFSYGNFFSAWILLRNNLNLLMLDSVAVGIC